MRRLDDLALMGLSCWVELGAGGVYTPVVTGSMRNRLRSQEIEAPRGAYDGGSKARRGSVGIPPPRVFLKKSVQSIENKGREVEKQRQESSRVRKGLEGKEISRKEAVESRGRSCLGGAGGVVFASSRAMIGQIIEVVNNFHSLT